MVDNRMFPSPGSRYWHELRILAERASRDLLSGLLNRETATSYIETCLKNMSSGEACALFIIDLDNFKQVNDTLGHQTGDHVIRQAARALSGCFRATDIVGRLGGDEFFALLSGTVTDDIVRQKARLICEMLQFSIGTDPMLHVTASVGVHIASASVPDFEYLYERADFALYEAKAKGKNCFRISEGDAGNIPERHVRNAVQMPLQLSSLLEHMNEGISLLEIGDSIRMLYASPSLRKMMSMAETCSLPCALAALDKIHPDDMAEYENMLREGTKSRKPVEHEHRFTTNGIDWRWRRVRAVQTPAPGDRPVMLVFSTDISAAKKNEYLLLEEQEKLRLLLAQGSHVLWEVDPASRTFRFFNAKHPGRTPGARMRNFPDSLMDNGWVHPDSAARFRRFADDILAGCAAGGGAFILRHKMSRTYGWFSVSYRTLPGGNGHAARVIGMVESLAGTGTQEKLAGKEHLWEALRPNLFCYLQANLSADVVETLWVEGKRLTERFRGAACRNLLEREAKNLFFKGDVPDFLRAFSRGELLDAFNRGHAWSTREYRRVDVGGNVRWISYTAHLSRNPLTHDIHVFAFLLDMERRHAREAALKEKIGHVPATGLYDRRTAKELAEHAMRDGTSLLHMLALVRVFRDSDSGPDRELRLQDEWNSIAMAFALLLGSDCVIGEQGEDRLTVFHPAPVSRVAARQRIDEAFAFVRKALSDTDAVRSLRFTASVACRNLRGADYDALLAEAEYICGIWENAPEDSVVFFSGSAGRSLEEYCGDATAALCPPDERQSLSGRQKDIAFSCLDALLMADTSDSAITAALNRIGSYYQADRVYTLGLMEGGQAVAVIHEWTAEGKQSLRSHLTGIPIDRLPLLKRGLKEKAPLYVTKKLSAPDHAAQCETWSYGVLPLTAGSEDEPEGFLCLENPKRHVGDTALLSALLPYIMHTHRRFSSTVSEQGSALRDSLTGLPNFCAYQDKAYLLNSDTYSSMGALALDMPGLASVSSSQGFEQAAKILLYIAENLAMLFGKSLLFRTRDAEFVTFCPNTTQEVFLGRVLRSQSLLQRRYPKLLRFGYTWTDGLFSGEKLMKEARTIMQCGQTADAPGADATSAGVPVPTGMTEAGWQNRFIVYLQPKIDMRTGSAVGAEALIRGIDETGQVVPPGRFIESMEKAGTLRELDLHVLNQTLALMENWREQGLENMTVSVNFSRFTLFSTSTPGAVLALLSRYPSIPPELLEIEITETAGDVENGTLERAMDTLRPFGLRFALDDFGSRYANLSVFTNVPFDTVKLDRSLIRELSYNAVSRTLVGDITRICMHRGMTCVAEGVETQAQVDALLGEGCAYAQGFFYDRPIPARDFEQKYLRPKHMKEEAVS